MVNHSFKNLLLNSNAGKIGILQLIISFVYFIKAWDYGTYHIREDNIYNYIIDLVFYGSIVIRFTIGFSNIIGATYLRHRFFYLPALYVLFMANILYITFYSWIIYFVTQEHQSFKIFQIDGLESAYFGGSIVDFISFLYTLDSFLKFENLPQRPIYTPIQLKKLNLKNQIPKTYQNEVV